MKEKFREMMTRISNPEISETDEDGDDGGSNKGPTHAEGFAALETAMLWYECQSECCSTKLLLLKGLRDVAAKKKIYISTKRNQRFLQAIRYSTTTLLSLLFFSMYSSVY